MNCQRDGASRLHFRAGGLDTVPCNVTVCRCDTPGYAAERGVAMRAPPARAPMQIERKRKPASRNAIVKSFARGLQVVKTLAEGHAPLTIAEVAERAQLTRAGARRLLLTLQELGYVSLRGRHFSLTPRIMELRCSYSTSAPIWMAVEEHLGALVDDINETASAGMLDDLDIVYVLRLRTPRAIHLDIESGSRLPAHITSIGRVLLADLHPRQLDRYFQRAVIEKYTPLTITEPKKLRAEIETVRQKGYSVVAGEVDEGVCGVAVPLREQSGRVIAAVGVGLTRGRAMNDDIQNRILPRMKSAVDSMRRQIDA